MQPTPHGAEDRAQAALVREVFGNPFRPVTLGPAHRTPTIVSLARAAYDERQLPGGEPDRQRLAVLVDALGEGGAPDELVACAGRGRTSEVAGHLTSHSA